jgi:hypothetical protein
MGREKQGRNCSPAGLTPVRVTLEFVDGVLPMVGDDEGVADAKQKMTASSET